MKNEDSPDASGGWEQSQTPIVAYPATRDVEYREAALRMAIAHFAAKGDHKVIAQQVVDVAISFERYLRNGTR